MSCDLTIATKCNLKYAIEMRCVVAALEKCTVANYVDSVVCMLALCMCLMLLTSVGPYPHSWIAACDVQYHRGSNCVVYSKCSSECKRVVQDTKLVM